MESGIWIQGLGSLLASLFLASHSLHFNSHLSLEKILPKKSVSSGCKGGEIARTSFSGGSESEKIDGIEINMHLEVEVEVEVEVEEACTELKTDESENDIEAINTGTNEDLEGIQLLSEATSDILKWTSNSPYTPRSIVTSSIRSDVLQVVQDSVFEIFKFCEQAQKEDDEDFGISYTEKNMKTEKSLLSFCDNVGREFLLQIIGESIFVGYSADVRFFGTTSMKTLKSAAKVSRFSSSSQNGEEKPYVFNRADSTDLKYVKEKNACETSASDIENSRRRKQKITDVYITLLSAVQYICEINISKSAIRQIYLNPVSSCPDRCVNAIRNDRKIIINNTNDLINYDDASYNRTKKTRSEIDIDINQTVSSDDAIKECLNILYNTESAANNNMDTKNTPLSTEQNVPKKVPKKRMFRVVIVAADDDEEPSPVVPKKKKKKTAVRYVILYFVFSVLSSDSLYPELRNDDFFTCPYNFWNSAFEMFNIFQCWNRRYPGSRERRRNRHRNSR